MLEYSVTTLNNNKEQDIHIDIYKNNLYGTNVQTAIHIILNPRRNQVGAGMTQSRFPIQVELVIRNFMAKRGQS